MILSALSLSQPLKVFILSETPTRDLPFYLPDGLALILFFIITLTVGLALIFNAMLYTPPVAHAAAANGHSSAHQTKSPAPDSSPHDDLKIIEGIGPAISRLLNENEIHTFAQLAATPASRLKEILDTASLRMADPSTWPEQAGLAATGDWERFDQLTELLKGGRWVE